jgi:hypothetical protein
MAEIVIADASPRVQYTVTSSTTGPWSIPWPYWEEADIKVYFDDVLKTITTHYTISGTVVDDGFSGGNVTAGSAQENITVTIVRDVAIARVTDHSPGLFNIATLNKELDKLHAMGQQLETDLTRVPRLAPEDVTPSSMDLPTPTSATTNLLWSTAGFTAGDSAQWLAGNGTVSLPYYSFLSDPNSGFYRLGADNVGLALGGAKAADFAATAAIFTGTVEAGGDTAAGDNAAMGYTSAEGLILTGQGSTNDITLKNDADAIVAKVATGTTNLDVIGNITGTDLVLSGDLTVNGTTVSLQITNQVTADPLVELNNGATSNANDLGVIMERGSTGDNIFVGWDESADEFIAATTTGTGSSTGNLTLAGYANAKFANVSLAQLTATSGTLAGITSLAMSAGATLTAGFLDQDDMSSDSAVAGATQQSIKAYVDTTAKAPGLQMTYSTSDSDADQGAGKVWASATSFTPGSDYTLYFDDVEKNGVSINALIDSLDDPTAENSATIYIQEAGSAAAGLVFLVNGSVTSATTYSKVAVEHVATFGTLGNNDVVGVTIAFSGDNGGGLANVVEDTSPQLGAALDTNAFSIQQSEGATVTAATTTNIWATDGDTIHITGETQIDDFANAPAVGIWKHLIFDHGPQVTHGSGITVVGGTQTMAAGDHMYVYADAVDAFRAFISKADGTAVVAGAGGGPSLGSDSVIRCNKDDIGENITFVAGDTLENGMSVGPITINSSYTVTVASGCRWVII